MDLSILRYIEGFSSLNWLFFFIVQPYFWQYFQVCLFPLISVSHLQHLKWKKKKNAVYGKWNRNVILATHGRISVAATVCACLFTYVLNLLLRITLSLDAEGVATRSVNEKMEVQYGPL